MKYINLLSLSWKKMGMIIFAFIASVILHNLISGWMGVEEAFFFVVAVFVIPAYMLVSVLFTVVNLVKKKN